MNTSLYAYNGQLWAPNPSVADTNSFFHAAFGVRKNESQPYVDKDAQRRRERWASFLSHFRDKPLPSGLTDLLRQNGAGTPTKIKEKIRLESYVAEIIEGRQGVKVEDIPMLATLENVDVTVLSKSRLNPVIVATPVFEILGNFPVPARRLKSEVLLCLEGHIFSRLSVVENTRGGAQEPSNVLVSYAEVANADSYAVEYQLNILTVILLNSLQKLDRWRLSFENQDTPMFGNVVLESSEGVIILRVRFKDVASKNITLENLLSTNPESDVSLLEYFNCFHKMKKKFQSIKYFIMCTNAIVDAEALTFLRIQSIGVASVLRPGLSDIQFYTFNDEFLQYLKTSLKEYYSINSYQNCINETPVTDENLKEFLTCLQIYCNYPPKGNITEVVQQLLSLTKVSKNLQIQVSYSELRSKMMDWFQRRPTAHLNECYAKAIFAEIWRDRRWKGLEKYNVRFKTNPFDFRGTKRIFHSLEEESLLYEIGICQSLENHKHELLYISPEDDAEVQENVIEAFELPQYIFLVFIASNYSDERALRKKLKHCLQKYGYKKVIIVSLESEFIQEFEVDDCEVLNESLGFEDLSKETQRKIMRKNHMIFQGEVIRMEELCTVEYYKKFLRPALVEKLIKDENIVVGTRPPGLDPQTCRFYISRQFNKKGDCKGFSEEDLCELGDKVVLISGEPEAGKSTVLTKLGIMLKEKFKHLWVIRIKIKDYMRVLKDLFARNRETMSIRELLDSNGATKFKHQLEIDVFSMHGKVVLLLDGVSDISPDYECIELIISMLTKCQKDKNFEKIFVSTGPDLTELLELELSIQHFTLSPMTEQNKLHFLINYWTHNLELNENGAEKCKKYGEALLNETSIWTELYGFRNLFTVFPTKLEMLAYIFMENNILGNREWQGCKEYLTREETQLKLPDKMNIKRFYETYIDRKRSEFVNMEKSSEDKRLIDQFEECLSFCRNLAVNVILGNNKNEYFSHRQQFSEHLKANLLKIGIVNKVCDDFHCTQRNFAEYFLAESIVRELPLENKNFEFKKFFFEEILLKPTFSTTRSFFGGFLDNFIEWLPRTTSKKRSSRSYDLDAKYVTTLIHQLAAEGCVDILRFILRLIGLKIVGNKSDEVCKTDAKILLCGKLNIDVRVDYRTPLHVASKNGHLDMVKYLVELDANVNAEVFGRTSLTLATDGEHYEVAIFLVEQGANVMVEDIRCRSLLYTATARGLKTIAESLFEDAMKRRSLRKDYLTLVYAAAYLNKMDILRTFLRNGVDVNSRVERGESLLFGAVRGGCLEIIQYLVERGADVNMKDNHGNTALHFISGNSKLNITAKLMVTLGADANVKKDWDVTPFEHAAFEDNIELVELLLKET